MENASVNISNQLADDSSVSLPLWVNYLDSSFLALICLIGIPGNSLILIIQRQNREKSSTDILIAGMAFYELICSSCNAMVRIGMNTKVWTHIGSDTVCGVHLFMIYTTTFASAYTLAAIAIDRYFKTCRPLSTFYTVKTSKVICGIISCVSFITAISPSITYKLDFRFDCSVAPRYETFQFFWDMALILSTMIIFAIFIFSYLNIAITLYQRVRVRSNGKTTNVSGNSETPSDQPSLLKAFKKLRFIKVRPVVQSANTSDSNGPSAASTSQRTEQGETTQPESQPSSKTTIRRNYRPATLAGETVNRTTLMLFLLTVIYAVTFTISNIFVLTRDAVLGRIMLKLGKSLLMVNCITNPVCFFGMSSKYRAVARKIIFRTRQM